MFLVLLPFFFTARIAFALIYHIDASFNNTECFVDDNEASFCILKYSFLKVYFMLVNTTINENVVNTFWFSILFSFFSIILMLTVFI